MARTHEKRELQLEQDIEYERRTWVVQRIGWVVMLFVILAALAGLFGSGPVSNAQTAAPDGSLQLEYQRFGHYKSPESLRLKVRANVNGGDELRIRIGTDYLNSVQVERVSPQPDRTEVAGDWITYVFPVAKSGEATTVTFHVKNEKVGPIAGWVSVEGGQRAAFKRFVYP